MQWFTAYVHRNDDLGADYSWITLEGCAALGETRPGQFVMLRGPWGRDPILPRAYSVLAVRGERAEFLVRRVGRGSRLLGAASPGAAITVLGPLGTSFPLPEPGVTDLLVAGGCGLPPLHLAATRALEEGREVELLLGARRREELVLADRLEALLGARLFSITETAGEGRRGGLVTDLLRERLELQDRRCRVLACGPEAMLRAVREVARSRGVACLLSLEAGMACGLGACLGCAVEARAGGYLHVCKDGPVFEAEEVWP
jgi:dihydroorotate dehydrogenase electron transfer subunit